MMNKTSKIAFLGTGLLGAPMAVALVRAGHSVTAWNRTSEKVERLASTGVTAAGDVATAVNEADAIVLMLADKAAITATLLSGEGRSLDLNGQTIVQMGTIGPSESVSLSVEFQRRGAQYLEAPVLGSIGQAESRSLIVMVGSDEEVFHQWTPLLAAFGDSVHYVGAVGKAAALKLALNQLIASLTTAFSLSFASVRAQGVNPDLFMEILRQSALFAPTFEKKFPLIEAEHFQPANFPLKHLLKDVNLMIESFGELQLDVAQLAAVKQVVERAIERGHKDDDYSALSTGIVLTES